MMVNFWCFFTSSTAGKIFSMGKKCSQRWNNNRRKNNRTRCGLQTRTKDFATFNFLIRRQFTFYVCSIACYFCFPTFKMMVNFWCFFTSSTAGKIFSMGKKCSQRWNNNRRKNNRTRCGLQTRTKDFATFNFLIRRQFTLLFLSVMLVKGRSLLYR